MRCKFVPQILVSSYNLHLLLLFVVIDVLIFIFVKNSSCGRIVNETCIGHQTVFNLE